MLRVEPEKLGLSKAELLRIEKELSEIEEELNTVLHRFEETGVEEEITSLKKCKKSMTEYRRAMYELMISLDTILDNNEKCKQEQLALLDRISAAKRFGDWVPIQYTEEELQVINVIQYENRESK